MPSSRVEGAILRPYYAPDCGLSGRKQRIDFRRQPQLAIAVERGSGEPSFQKILIGVHLPACGGGSGKRSERAPERCQHAESCDSLHSFTSTGTVFDPVTTASPVGISNSSTFDPRGSHRP